MKTIAFHLNNLERGGSERVAVTLSARFAAAGYRVILATEYEGQNEFVPDERVERVHVGLLPGDEKRGRLSKIFLRKKYLAEYLKKDPPNVLVTFARKADYRALSAAKGTGVPVVVAIRTNPAGQYDTLPERFLVKRLFPRAAGAVFQTEGQRLFFKPLLQENSCIILNPIDEKYFIAPQTAREQTIVHHARLAKMKNQALLIRAFLRVSETHPDYVLKIYGDDSGDGTKQELEALIAARHAEDKVFLMGGKVRFEEEIPKGAVYVFGSDWEGLPNSLLEAMAMGMPVVSTDCPCGGPATVIEDGVNGLLVPVGDEEAMAEAISRLIDDRVLAERLGENARKIRDLANADAVYERWRDYLKSAVSGTMKESV